MDNLKKGHSMTRTYQWSYGDVRLTAEQLKEGWSWANVHPEMQRRALALADASQDAGRDLGFGEGARNPVQQLAEFYRRHDLVATGGCCTYSGKRYKLKAGMSPISPPGYSNHDDEIYEGCALAIDFVGWEDHWFDANCERFGIKNFGGAIGPGVNGEEWHGQPIELPNSRRDVTAYFANGGKLKAWPLPGDTVIIPPVVSPTLPVPQPTDPIQEYQDMLYIIQTTFPGKTDATAHLVKFEDGHIERAFGSTYEYAKVKGLPVVPENSPEPYQAQAARISEIPVIL